MSIRISGPRCWLLALACVVTIFATRKADAFVTEGVAWGGGATSFDYILTGGTAAESTALSSAMQEWNAVTAFRFTPVAGSTDPCNSGQPNGAAFSATSCGSAFDSSTLAVTFYQTRGSGNLTHAGIVFNSNKTFNVYDGPLQSFAIDIQRVATHEFGHVLGLDHEMDPNIPAIMAPNVSSIDRPTADDIAGVASIYGPASANQTTVVSSILPTSRSVQVNNTATAFAAMINAGTQDATGCSIGLATTIAANFSYQTTSASTNQAIGSPNTPVAISAGGAQTFVISVTPTALLRPTDVAFNMRCANAPAASSISGVNTLLLSASNTPTPDIVALAATAQNDGYVHIGSGSGAFALATINLGAAATVTVSADTGTALLPLTVTLCQTNPSNAQCITPMGSTLTNIAIGANGTPTFSIFVNATAAVAPDPANKRVFVRFRDSTGATRGSTSVAVTSQ